MQSLTNQLRLALEPECLKNPRHRWEKSQGWNGFSETLKLFVVSDVGRRMASPHGCGTFEQILQIVIVIAVQSANRDRLLRSSQLSVDTSGARHCCASRFQTHCSSRAVAWCGTGAVSGSKPSAKPPESDRSKESERSNFHALVFLSSPPIVRAALVGAEAAERPAVGSRTLLGGAHRLR
jgi:hypothetical protein